MFGLVAVALFLGGVGFCVYLTERVDRPRRAAHRASQMPAE